MGTVQNADKKFKSWLASKTIWGIIIALLPVIHNLTGVNVGTEVAESYGELISIIGSAVALYGRWKANTNIVVGKITR